MAETKKNKSLVWLFILGGLILAFLGWRKYSKMKAETDAATRVILSNPQWTQQIQQKAARNQTTFQAELNAAAKSVARSRIATGRV